MCMRKRCISAQNIDCGYLLLPPHLLVPTVYVLVQKEKEKNDVRIPLLIIVLLYKTLVRGGGSKSNRCVSLIEIHGRHKPGYGSINQSVSFTIYSLESVLA